MNFNRKQIFNEKTRALSDITDLFGQNSFSKKKNNFYKKLMAHLLQETIQNRNKSKL